MTYTYKPALTGPALDAALEQTAAIRPALIEGLVYERSILLVSADGGTGKSTLVANVIAQSSVGLPVFGSLFTPRPLLCYYIPFERGSEEIRERLKHMRSAIPFNTANIVLFDNDEFIPNLYEKADQDFLLDSIARDCGDRKPDIVFYDPIYSAVAGGLCNEDKVSVFLRFNVRLMKTFGCATWLNHHTGKQGYASDGTKIQKDDPYYGSSFLRNHCTGSYYVKESDDKGGTTWIEKKDNLKSLLSKLTLNFDDETFTSTMKGDLSELSAGERLTLALRQFRREGKPFTFKQLLASLGGVSKARLRQLLCLPDYTPCLKKHKSLGDSTLYEVIGEV